MDDNNTFDNENRNHPEKRQNHKHGRHYKKRHNGGRPSGQPREKAEADALTFVSGEPVAEAVRDGSSAKQDAPQNRQKSRNGRNRKRRFCAHWPTARRAARKSRRRWGVTTAGI